MLSRPWSAASTSTRRGCARGETPSSIPSGRSSRGKSWMGATHFQMRTLKKVGTEMALHVLAYNLKRVMNILGIRPLIAAIRGRTPMMLMTRVRL